MVSLSFDNLILAIFLIAPGFITVFTAITFGVIEREISNSRMLIISLIMSMIVDATLLTIAQLLGRNVESPSATKAVFFEPTFRPEYVLLLFIISFGYGFLFSELIIRDFHGKIRDNRWKNQHRIRFPWQPWESTMKESYAVKVDTSNKESVKGILLEYSRAEKPRQLRLSQPRWWDQEAEDWIDEDESSVLLFSNDIERISVLMTQKEKDQRVGGKDKEQDGEATERSA